MDRTIGEALRSLRQGVGLSQTALAARALTTKAHIANIEADRRRLTSDLAEACDRVLGSTPLLATLAAIGGDDVNRRTLLRQLGEASAIGAISGPGGLAELVRSGLLAAAGVQQDWDSLIDDYRHRLTVDGSVAFGQALHAQLMVVQQRLIDSAGSPELLRAAAALGHVYGLWLGNTGQISGAHGWYTTASELAVSSGDRTLTSYVYGRSASRAIYEGWTVARTVKNADTALELSAGAPTAGALEAYAALVHVYALTGDASAGRAAAAAMLDVAASIDDTAKARALFLRAFGEARYGTADTAQAAHDEARPVLAPHPLWGAEADVYLGRALIAAGDTTQGVHIALNAVQSLRHGVRVVGVAVRDAVTSAPKGTHSEDFELLKSYADPSPGPWETLR